MKKKPKKAKDERLFVGENICDDEIFMNLCLPPGTKLVCKYRKTSYGRCAYKDDCGLQTEVTERDAREYPEIIRMEEDE